MYEQEDEGDFVPDADSGGYDDPGFEGTLTSTGPTMYLKWESDSSVTYPGWKASLHLVYNLYFIKTFVFFRFVYPRLSRQLEKEIETV